jgi:hypothetical protein
MINTPLYVGIARNFNMGLDVAGGLIVDHDVVGRIAEAPA